MDNVVISRHARNRMRLYHITRREVERAMQEGTAIDTLRGPRRVLNLGDEVVTISYVREGDAVVVTTVFATGRRRRERRQ